MSVGYDKLKAAVDKDCKKDGGTIHLEGCVTCGGKCFHKYCNKFKWVIDRAKAYGEATGRHGKRRFCLCKRTAQRRDYVHAGILGAGQSIIARRKTSVVKYIIVCAQKKSIEKHIVVDVEMFSQNRR